MNNYLVTFFTHFDAVCCARALKNRGISAVMAPVPRALSSSCGTCVRFGSIELPEAAVGEQFEQVFQQQDREYVLLCDRRNES